MTQGNYIQESTQDLIRRAQQTTIGVPTLDLTDWNSPKYISGNSRIRSLAGSCHKIEVKTTVDGETSKCPIEVASSIVFCTGPTIGTCPTDTAAACPTGGTISTTQYVNFIAVFTMGAAQTGVEVTFKYLLNDTPTKVTKTVDVTAGSNIVYAFDPNEQYDADTTIALYGAEVLA